MASSGSAEDVLRQVDQFWSMLDDLCQNDPAAYRKFMETQLKEGTEYSAPPVLDSCLCTEILGPKKGLLYINICSWKRVPAPQDPSRPLPVCAGKLETDTDEGQGAYTVMDVALNPAVLQDSEEDKAEVYMMALSFAQQQFGLTLSQQYTLISSGPKSSPDDLHRRLGFRQCPKVSKQTDTASQTPAALIRQISSLRSEKQDVDTAAQIIHQPAEHKKKDLIQVISTSFAQPQKPDYQLEVKTDTAGVPRSVELTVELPKVCSMSDCQLRISKDDVLLEVEDVYYLLLEFPKTVNEDTASAIFNKKKRRLTMRVDVF
ncbi:PIH1 domain-containing protein 2 isoform X1 [Sparus aurata]|uniref:PIH1 domain containing 2 n=1 Tax=Sparus aurata TaxID=8175 RepID=A0A671UN30_SPAAU|nr:PIH1 domain-containing protein 2 isoform X1 [Sparus aurata]